MKLRQLEFQSHNIEASLRFVEGVLGWKKVPVSIQDQIIIEMPDDTAFGISIRAVPQGEKNAKAPSGSLAYFESEKDLASLRPLVIELGGLLLSEVQVVTGYGKTMLVEDPGGIRFGLYEARFEGPSPGPKA